MNNKEVYSRIAQYGIVPCARVKVPEEARYAAETLYDSGIPVVEIPTTLPEAPEVIEGLAKRFPDLVVGAGTVLDAETTGRCIAAGARFITSPGFVPEVVEHTKKANVLAIPGALTATEILAAWKAGSDFVKIFPTAMAGGTHYIRALKAALPDIPLIVTGGVNQLTAFDYIFAGAIAIGVGGEILPAEALHRKQTKRIHELSRRFLQRVQEARTQLQAEY